MTPGIWPNGQISRVFMAVRLDMGERLLPLLFVIRACTKNFDLRTDVSYVLFRMYLCPFEFFVLAKWQNKSYPQGGGAIEALSDFSLFSKNTSFLFNEIKERKKRV